MYISGRQTLKKTKRMKKKKKRISLQGSLKWLKGNGGFCYEDRLKRLRLFFLQGALLQPVNQGSMGMLGQILFCPSRPMAQPLRILLKARQRSFQEDRWKCTHYIINKTCIVSWVVQTENIKCLMRAYKIDQWTIMVKLGIFEKYSQYRLLGSWREIEVTFWVE